MQKLKIWNRLGRALSFHFYLGQLKGSRELALDLAFPLTSKSKRRLLDWEFWKHCLVLTFEYTNCYSCARKW